MLDTDACEKHVYCVLLKEQSEGPAKPVRNCSHLINKAEMAYVKKAEGLSRFRMGCPIAETEPTAVTVYYLNGPQRAPVNTESRRGDSNTTKVAPAIIKV